jgi:hypothetical protein
MLIPESQTSFLKLLFNYELFQPRLVEHPVWGKVIELVPVRCGSCLKYKECRKPIQKSQLNLADECKEWIDG